MITTKRVSLVVLTIASLCSLNANAMWQNSLESLRAFQQVRLQRKSLLGKINGFSKQYDDCKRLSNLEGQEQTLQTITQDCKKKTGYTDLDKTYNGFYDRSKTLERLNVGIIGSSWIATLGITSAVASGVSFGPGVAAVIFNLPTITAVGVLAHGSLMAWSYANEPTKFGGAPRLRGQFVRQQYPYFGLAKEQPAETK